MLRNCANKNFMAIMIIRCKIYFVFFIFVVCANHENIFTTKISRSTVLKTHVNNPSSDPSTRKTEKPSNTPTADRQLPHRHQKRCASIRNNPKPKTTPTSATHKHIVLPSRRSRTQNTHTSYTVHHVPSPQDTSSL